MAEVTAQKKQGLAHELRAQTNPPFMKLDYFTMLWLFVIASIVGLVLETIFHAIVYGGYESRAGLVWGPFSPIYGVGAVVITLILNRLYYAHNIVIFAITMALGTLLEYIASLVMEVLWGAIAWDYTGTLGSIGGRTNFAFGVMWGLLGIFWARLMMPLLKDAFSHFDFKKRFERGLSWTMTAFLAFDISVTCLVLMREDARKAGTPPANQLEVLIDDYFPNEWCESHFQNMTVTGSNVEHVDQNEDGGLPPLMPG